MQDFFRLIGEFSITEDRKKELNEIVLNLLDKCGIRMLKEVEHLGKKMTVISRLEPDSNGIISFNYSIFEKKKRNISTYNLNTCELIVDDCGFCEFGMPLMLLLTLKESYSATRCYLILDEEIWDVNSNAVLIENILNIRLRFPFRADIWGMYMFVRKNLTEDVSLSDMFDWFPSDFEELNFQQLYDVRRVSKGDDVRHELVEVSRGTITSENYGVLDNCLYSTYLKLHTNDGLTIYVRELLQKDFEERKIMAQDQTEYATLAEISLYATPIALVRVLANVKKISFFDMWEELSIDKVYQDNINGGYDKDAKTESYHIVHFFKAIQRKNADELLGVWDDKKLQLSENMVEAIKNWKEKYGAIEITDDYEVEKELLSILRDLNDEWDIEYVEEEFIAQFVENKNDISYKKALRLLRILMDKEVKYYPELTRRQAFQWVIIYGRDDFKAIEINGLIRVLTNKKTRNEIFGC